MPWRKGNRLKLVSEAEASEPIRRIYAETKEALGVPFVSTLFQAYAAYPLFLELHWRALKPVVETEEFFRLAGRLRAEAYTRIHNYFTIPDLCAQMTDLSFSEGARHELTEVVELFHYANPVLLLIVSAQLQGFDTPAGEPRPAHRPAAHPVFPAKPVLVEEDNAPPAVRKVFEDVKQVLGLPIINTHLRAMARWPDFLSAYWGLLRSIAPTPLYVESQFGVRETAWTLAREIPQGVDLQVSALSDAGMSDDDIASVVRITELYLKALSAQVLNITVAKIALEGGTSSTNSPDHDGFQEVEIEPPERAA